MINEPNYTQNYQVIIKEIMRDIELEDLNLIRKDPIGNAFYLYYILKNNERGYELDGLVSLMNEWVEEIITNERITRSLDVEISSALFTYGMLKKYNKLMKKIQTEKMNYTFTKYLNNGHFFNNYLLSVIIAIGAYSFKEDLIEYEQLTNWIINNYGKNVSVSDSKTIFYTYILFELIKEEEKNRGLIETSLKLVVDKEVIYDDEIYYSYISWSERENIKDVSKYQIIRSFVSSTLKNMDRIINNDEENISKLKKGIYLDLYNLFNSDTIRVSKKELERKDIPRIIFVMPLASLAGFMISLYLFFTIISGALYLQINSLYQIPEDLWVKIGFDTSAIVLGVIILITSVSLLYDVVILRITNLKLVRENLKKRIEKHVRFSLIGAAIQAIQTWIMISNA